MPPLQNARHEKFAVEYTRHYKVERAVIAAGFNARTMEEGSTSATSIGTQLIKKPKIAARIAELQERRLRNVDITKENLLHELKGMAFFDIRRLVDRKTGRRLDIHELDDVAAKMVAGVETEELFEGQGRDRVQVGYTKKVKLWDKLSAIEKLMKHFSMLGQSDQPQGGAMAAVNLTVYMPENGRNVKVIGNGHTSLSGTCESGTHGEAGANGRANGHGVSIPGNSRS